METYYLGAYWQPRQEPLNNCTGRIHDFLTCIRDCDPSFSRWYPLGHSRAHTLGREISITTGSIRSLVLKGAHHDGDGNIVEELGYHVSMWNGAASDEEAANLSITCGSAAPSLKNACVLSLPTGGEVANRVLGLSVLQMLVRCTVLTFDPDWCVVMSRSYRDSQATWSPNEPRAGWLLYISNRLGELPLVGWPIQADTLNGLGTLFVSTTERFSANNVAHVKAAVAIDQTLRDYGLLSH